MAQKEFILQGFTTRTHNAAVQDLFKVAKIQRVLLSVAFATENGVALIEPYLKPHSSKLTTFVGIRNDVTTYQGLTRLHGLGGIHYAVDTGARGVLFHPKLYLVRGSSAARLIIGSANLTLGGLNNNIEAGFLVNFDLSNSSDKAVVDSIESELDKLPNDYTQHVLKIDNKSKLDDWLKAKRLVDELAIRPPKTSSSGASGAGSTDDVPRISLKVKPLHPAVKKAAAAKKAGGTTTKKSGQSSQTSQVTAASAAFPANTELVWESKPLARRDLTIPAGNNSNQTGSINLDKGLLDENVDHRHYFRDDVFTALPWAQDPKRPIEHAFGKFHLVVKGNLVGTFDLLLSHSTSTTSKTYLQRNAVTRLSWGPARPFIARADLIDRTLALYRDQQDPTQFVIEID